MKRLLAFSVLAAAAVVPAVVGLAGNASFAETVPVRVPAQAQVEDDPGSKSAHLEPGDDGDDSRHHEDDSRHHEDDSRHHEDDSRHHEDGDSRHNGDDSRHSEGDDSKHHEDDDSRHSGEGSGHS